MGLSSGTTIRFNCLSFNMPNEKAFHALAHEMLALFENFVNNDISCQEIT